MLQNHHRGACAMITIITVTTASEGWISNHGLVVMVVVDDETQSGIIGAVEQSLDGSGAGSSPRLSLGIGVGVGVGIAVANMSVSVSTPTRDDVVQTRLDLALIARAEK